MLTELFKDNTNTICILQSRPKVLHIAYRDCCCNGTLQNENVKSVKDALEQLVCKESLQGYTCTKSKLEVSRHVLFHAKITSRDDIYISSEVAKCRKCNWL